jgi:hypothetical protein
LPRLEKPDLAWMTFRLIRNNLRRISSQACFSGLCFSYYRNDGELDDGIVVNG